MSYQSLRNSLWDKRIPTLLGLGVIVIGIAATTFLVNTGTITIGQASSAQSPKDIRITNVSDSSFTVSYSTDTETTGSVSYGVDTALGSIALDEKDQGETGPQNHKIHYVTVKNLFPNTTYHFAIISAGNRYIKDNEPFVITTAPTLSANGSSQKTINGTVILPDGSSPKEAVIYLTASGTQTASTLVNANGSYSLSLETIRTENLASHAVFSDNTALQILAIDPAYQSNAILLVSTSPVPSIILSKDYDFSSGDSPATTPPASFGFPTLSATTSGNTPVITAPKKDEAFQDQQPIFKGTASPGATVKIIIESEQKIEGQVSADKNGNWTFRPQETLSPGIHTITIIAPDPFGVLKTIKQTFTVFAEGSQVNQSATPSATPTITSTPQPTSTPTPTLSITPNISPTISSTPSPTLVPSFTPTPTPTPIFIQITPPAQPGNPTTTIGIIGIATTVIGILILLLSRGNLLLP